jgi:hypothetical protein
MSTYRLMHNRWWCCLVAAFHMWVITPALADCSTEAVPNRDPSWAAPIKLTGVPNLYRVAPNFYRSAQPDREGFAELVRRCKLQTVIDLRAESSDAELLKGLKVSYFHFSLSEFLIWPSYVIPIGALQQLIYSVRRGPTLLHCEAGANRTGLVSALYRVAKQGWSADTAIDELEYGGYGFFFWLNIPAYIRWADVVVLKHDRDFHAQLPPGTRTYVR